MFKNNLFFIFILALTTSCTTQLKYHMNNHKFITPETKGEFLKGDVSISYQQTQKVIIADAFDLLVFNLPAAVNTSSNITRSNSVDLPLNLGLLNRLDFLTLDTKYGLKYQFLGTAENERSVGYKSAIALAYGYDHKSTSDVNYSNSSTSRIYSTDILVKSYEASLLFGYRISERDLVYLNIFRDFYKYNGVLKSSQFATIEATGKSYNQGILAGFEFSFGTQKYFLSRTEIGFAAAKLDNHEASTVGTFGTDFGWSW